MWRSNTASNPPATKHCGPSVAAMTSRRPGRLLRRAPHGGCTSEPISFWGCPAKTTKCFFGRWSGSMPCRSKRSSSTSCSSFGERPLPPNTTPSPAASACVPPRSISRWWSRCCGGCVPIWLWSVSPAKCRMGFHHLTQWHLTRVSTLWSLLEKRLTARNAYQGEIFIPLRR